MINLCYQDQRQLGGYLNRLPSNRFASSHHQQPAPAGLQSIFRSVSMASTASHERKSEDELRCEPMPYLDHSRLNFPLLRCDSSGRICSGGHAAILRRCFWNTHASGNLPMGHGESSELAEHRAC